MPGKMYWEITFEFFFSQFVFLLVPIFFFFLKAYFLISKVVTVRLKFCIREERGEKIKRHEEKEFNRSLVSALLVIRIILA